MLKGMTAVPDYTGVQAFQLPCTPSRNSTGSASLNRKLETAASISWASTTTPAAGPPPIGWARQNVKRGTTPLSFFIQAGTQLRRRRSRQNSLPSGSSRTCHCSSPVWPISAGRAPIFRRRSSSASWSRSAGLMSMCSRSLPVLGPVVGLKIRVGCSSPNPSSGLAPADVFPGCGCPAAEEGYSPGRV